MNQLNTNVHDYSVNFACIYGLLCCRPTDLSSMFAVVVCIVVVVCVVDSQRELLPTTKLPQIKSSQSFSRSDYISLLGKKIVDGFVNRTVLRMEN